MAHDSGTRSSPGCPPNDRRPRRTTVTFVVFEGLAGPVEFGGRRGPRDVIWRARGTGAKAVGGGESQAGIAATDGTGLVALSDGPEGLIDRLAEDHANAVASPRT